MHGTVQVLGRKMQGMQVQLFPVAPSPHETAVTHSGPHGTSCSVMASAPGKTVLYLGSSFIRGVEIVFLNRLTKTASLDSPKG